jgi:hypothetical protein
MKNILVSIVVITFLGVFLYLYRNTTPHPHDAHELFFGEIAQLSSMVPADKDLSKLDPAVAQAAKLLMLQSKHVGLHIFITEWWRSSDRQRALYAQGRTTPGKIVTWTLKSHHMTGRAFDIAFDPKIYGTTYPDDQKLRMQVGEIGESLWLQRWGRWKTRDMAHFQAESGSKTPFTGLPLPPSSQPIWVTLIDQFVSLYGQEKINKELLLSIPSMLQAYIKTLDIKKLAKQYIEELNISTEAKDGLLRMIQEQETTS